MEAAKPYTARITRRTELPNGRVHTTSVTLHAAPCLGETQVLLAEGVLRKLETWFGPHFEHGRHCGWSGVAAQIAMANVAGEMPRVGRTKFSVAVIDVALDSGLDWETSGWLLSMASMDAVPDYLIDFERSQS
jgi:hypothetical protein